MIPTIVIVDIDTGVDKIDKVAAALQRQALEHFAPRWNIGVMYRAALASAPPKPGEWRMELRKTPTIDDALGFHDRQADGTPLLYVFPPLCLSCGDEWSGCAGHEGLEAAADPGLHRCVELPDGSVMAVEVCDQVEADTYLIDGVTVPNFNTPENFEPAKTSKAGDYDYLKLQKDSGEVRPGGYKQLYTTDKGWTQVGTMRPYRQAIADMNLSRLARRKLA